ncbi:insulinase family protein [Candidatus Sumerlaeota bacterium]|nr:insulinase family protein [Candidatus Sumerlaeota bacterium]
MPNRRLLLGIIALIAWTLTSAPAQNEETSGSERENRGLAERLETMELDNGIRVMLVPNSSNQVLAIKGFLDIGLMLEPAEQSGLSNLTHQLLLKGTQTRSAEEISEAIESVGGSIGVSVQHDYSEIAVIATIDQAELSLELIADCLFRPAFPAEQLDKERQFVLSRIRIAEDQPPTFALKQFNKEIYPGHSYGRPVLGEPETLLQLTREDVKQFHRQYYQPARLTLVAMGDFEAGGFGRKVEQYFGEFSNDPGRTIKVSKSFSQRYSMKQFDRDVEQQFICYGFPVCAANNPDIPALRVATAILGEGMSSRMFTELRDKQGLAYQVGGRLSLRREAANVIFYIGTQPQNSMRAVNGISSEIDRLQEEQASDAEMERAKNYIIGKFQIAHQTNMACVSILGSYDQLGLGAAYDQLFEEDIRRVTAQDVQAAARQYFKTPVIVQVGPRME